MTVPKFGLAVLLTLVAALVTALLWPFLEETPFVVVISMVVVSAWRGGFGPGMLTALAGVFAVKYLLVEPRYVFIASASDVAQLVFFLLLTFFISWLEENRNQTEQALRGVRDELETILNGVADGITAQDASGRVVFANAAAVLVTQPRCELLDEDGSPLPDSALPRRHVFATGTSSERVFQQRALETGQTRWIRLQSAPVFDKQGRVRLAVNIFRDITERRQALLARQENEKRLRKVLDSLASFVAVLTPDGSLVEVNRPALEAIRLKAEELAGQRLDALSPWEVSSETPALMRDAIRRAAAGETVRFDTQARLAGDRVIAIDFMLAPVYDDDGLLQYLIASAIDITQRRQNEEALRNYAQELTRSNQELGQFAYVASHDLQEPLRMVTSYLQLIEKRYRDKLDSDGLEFIDYAVDGATRMKTLINDLLAYSRLDRAQTPYEQVDMETSVLMAIHNLQLAIQDAGARVTYDPLPRITANETHMIQLLQNLIGNALKFRSEAAPLIHIGCKRVGGDWQFSVRDNGIGIEPDYLERIFVIFQRLHPRERYPGTGIGLAICKKIVESHDGRIWAESQPGVGSAFYFSIPVKQRKRISLHGEHEGR
jgi:PAS domain S-box-containing protein